MKTLTFSASFFEEEEEEKSGSRKAEKRAGAKKPAPTEEEQKKKEKGQENVLMGGTVAISIVLAVAIFMVLPYYISVFFQRFITSQTLLALLEGVIRLTIFIGYVAAISLMPDIKRVYMYHGAEHKCINCIEQGMDLTVENVRKSSRLHKRCGTSFLLIVMLISIVFFLFIRVDNPVSYTHLDVYKRQPRVKRGYCLLILGEGKTTAYQMQSVFMDSLKTEFDPDRFYGI